MYSLDSLGEPTTLSLLGFYQADVDKVVFFFCLTSDSDRQVCHAVRTSSNLFIHFRLVCKCFCIEKNWLLQNSARPNQFKKFNLCDGQLDER